MQKNLTVRELPDTERPYEKCLKYGAGYLSDAELIAVVIRTGSQGERSVDLACRILKAGEDGLLNLFSLSIEELVKIRGIGTVKAIQLKCIAEISRRISSRKREEGIVMREPRTVAAYFMDRLRHERQEHLVLAMFGAGCRYIGDETITIGTSTASLVSPSDIFRKALLCGAQAIILLHNHPGGDPLPSMADREVTCRVLHAGILIGIPLEDHIIIGNQSYYSFRENNELPDSELL